MGLTNQYYRERLSADRLRRCYEIAPQRVRQYLEEELKFVLDRVRPGDLALDLGCGYGRILLPIARKARRVVGIDNSFSSLQCAREAVRNSPGIVLAGMDASRLSFPDQTFDVVICIQNGISAFHVDQEQLVRESVRVTRRGGTVLFSSYSEKFWSWRLEWFRRQSEAGLVGEIDFARTGNGVIICKDGFTASTVDGGRFLALAAGLGVDATVVEVDGSSLFCEMRYPPVARQS